MHDQCVIQIDPKSKFLIAAQMDGICFGQLFNKQSVPTTKLKTHELAFDQLKRELICGTACDVRNREREAEKRTEKRELMRKVLQKRKAMGETMMGQRERQSFNNFTIYSIVSKN